VDPEQVKSLLQQAINAEEVQVQGDGSHFDVLVVSSEFEGLSPVKKQQLVYQVLNEHIASGSIHAVNMKTLTPAEWQA
jgi:acid stress-induced BolA-like protein IbaG/YrbA